MSKRLIPITRPELLVQNGILFTRKTLAKWHSENTHPEIFLKVSGRVYIDLERWEEMLKRAEEKRDEKASRILKK